MHLRGRLTRLPDDALCDHLDRLSADQERRLLPKTPWIVAKMTPDARDEVWRRAAEAVTGAPSGQEVAALSGLMRDPPR